ncbi:unnamed protein product [Triticum turgidum subsp. durum]|uniref:DC1 domain-containing protein n=1 Tax=Triticum turgidum subsp. durum TaxID=4567 RepID=A0A9R1BV46_TRITD|nr:unnamed protein product [Triticum turgidum subsp. durum]
MAQRQDIVISHFSHPGHELVKRHHTGLFRCDMCWEDLSGMAYICRAGCDFCIHESCAGHSQTFSSPEHHVHPLTLVQTRRDATLSCDVCFGLCAPSSFLYRCPPCGFDMHPTCALLPQVVRSVRDPTHDLTLVVADGCCAACDTGAGHASYYRCTACNVDYHISCAASTGDNNSAHEAQDALDAQIVRSRIQEQTRNAILDLWSPAYTVRREYF